MDFRTCERNNLGRIVLNSIPHTILKRGFGSGEFSDYWIDFGNNDLALLKSPLSSDPQISGIYPEGFLQIQEDECNPLVASEVARQFNVPVAQYYLVTLGFHNNHILSPSFLVEDEELISGTSIIPTDKNDEETNLSKILEICENQLRLRNYSEEEIASVKFDFIKQCFVSKFIGNVDERQRNWGIIINNGHVRLAPMFDLDYCFMVAETPNIVDYRRALDNGKTDIASFIMQYKDYPRIS